MKLFNYAISFVISYQAVCDQFTLYNFEVSATILVNKDDDSCMVR